MARRGRPRAPNAKRRQTTVEGRMPASDHGPLLAQFRRVEALGAAVLSVEDGRVVADVDPSLSRSQLAVLLARGALGHGIRGRRRLDAGERYQELAWAAYGRPFARAVDVGRPRGDGAVPPDEGATDGDDRRRSGARRALARADARLAADAGEAALLAVKRVCQFDRPLDAEALPLLARGLDALASLWERGHGPRR